MGGGGEGWGENLERREREGKGERREDLERRETENEK